MTDIALTRRFTNRIAAPTRFIELQGAGHFPVEEPGATQLADAVTAFINDPDAPSEGEGWASREAP